MAKRYVPFHIENQLYAKTGGGLTLKISEAVIIGHTVKEKEAWNRLGYNLVEVEIMVKDKV